MDQRILIVDKKDIGHFIKNYLELEHYQTDAIDN